MSFSMMNPRDPIHLDHLPAAKCRDTRPAQVLTLMYSTLSARLAQAVYAVEKGKADSEQDFRQAQRVLADVRASIDPNARSTTVTHLRSLLAYVAERLALSDDRLAALKEARRLVDPIATAFGELADAGGDSLSTHVLNS